MKIMVFLIGLLLLIPILNTNAFQKDNCFEDNFNSQRNILITKLVPISEKEMAKMFGGCGGGGSCVYVFKSCDIGCTSHSVKACNNGTGTCTNNVYSISCVCITYYNVVAGCL
jgi:hypothetical protein